MQEIFYILFSTLSRQKSSAYVTLAAHLSSDQPHFNGSIAKGGSWRPHWKEHNVDVYCDFQEAAGWEVLQAYHKGYILKIFLRQLSPPEC